MADLEYTTDVVIVGSGTGGMVSAPDQEGIDALILEKSAFGYIAVKDLLGGARETVHEATTVVA